MSQGLSFKSQSIVAVNRINYWFTIKQLHDNHWTLKKIYRSADCLEYPILGTISSEFWQDEYISSLMSHIIIINVTRFTMSVTLMRCDINEGIALKPAIQKSHYYKHEANHLITYGQRCINSINNVKSVFNNVYK